MDCGGKDIFELYRLFKEADIIKFIKIGLMRFAGHICRMDLSSLAPLELELGIEMKEGSREDLGPPRKSIEVEGVDMFSSVGYQILQLNLNGWEEGTNLQMLSLYKFLGCSFQIPMAPGTLT
ncbi:hypothetical protein CEXT_467181 [Caerostris extrusa]|uniref:Uncharacterized protein n=1 Tax=Caerostris extrusa TaxID=172846 RepID=A0AAV4WD71_CAEEX|nr:hypothetical protein CEXT_467181 [Caerostris extrusa]